MTRDVSGHGMFVFAEHGPRRGELVTVQLEGQSALECVVRHVVPGVGVGIELLTREGREFAAFHELVAEHRFITETWLESSAAFPLLEWSPYDELMRQRLDDLFASSCATRTLHTPAGARVIEVLDSSDTLYRNELRPPCVATLYRADGEYFVVLDAQAARVHKLGPGDELMLIDFGAE